MDTQNWDFGDITPYYLHWPPRSALACLLIAQLWIRSPSRSAPFLQASHAGPRLAADRGTNASNQSGSLRSKQPANRPAYHILSETLTASKRCCSSNGAGDCNQKERRSMQAEVLAARHLPLTRPLEQLISRHCYYACYDESTEDLTIDSKGAIAISEDMIASVVRVTL